MFRFAVIAVALYCSPQFVAVAAEPSAAVVVVSDRATAVSLPPLPSGFKVVVLIQQEGEPDEVIHARALAMRDATHFVYHGGREPLLSAMYRERFVTHGATAIDLRKHLSRQRLRSIPSSRPSVDTFLATLSA